MYFAIYDGDLRHITNVDNATYELTQRVYDPDTFSGSGTCCADINDAALLIVNTDAGDYEYACLANGITPDGDDVEVKGKDFKTLFNTEILLDYTQPDSFDGRLSAIFGKVCGCVFETADAAVKHIGVTIDLPEDNTDTTGVYGSLQGTYQLVNAYTFLKGYLKYYEYNIESRFNVTTKNIEFTFVRCLRRLSVNLADFIYELTTTTGATNKTVATIKYTATPQTNDAGETIKDVDGNEIMQPRPEDLATVYYYLTKDNQIVQAAAAENIEGRIYPVVCKWYEAEYLADAQFDAVYELANARYLDNVILDNSAIIDPIDLAAERLYSKIDLYHDGKFYKTLPITEKITKVDEGGKNIKIKLGFKKIFLTEIVKAKQEAK